MFEEYKSFDVDRFFGEYEDNKIRLKEYKRKYDSIADSTSQSTEPKVSGGEMRSQVESRAERREKIAKKIDQLERYFAVVTDIIDMFEKHEQFIIKEYFIQNQKTERDVVRISMKLNMGQATCYRRIRDIRQRVREYMRDN